MFPPATVVSTLLPFTGTIAFLGGSGNHDHIYVMNADGSGVKDITPPNLLSILDLTWSPGAQYIAFDAATNLMLIRQIYKMKADGSDLTQLTFGQQSSYGPSWSPDGNHIIFTHNNENIQDEFGYPAQQLYIMKSDGTGVQQLIGGNQSISAYSYRNDGFISVSTPVTRDLMNTFIIDSEGVIQTQFPAFTNDMIPAWSPDGKTIVSTTTRPTDCSGIVVMKFDGSDEVCLRIEGIIWPPTATGSASWSPDGKYIIFSAMLDGKWNLYVSKPDGTDLIQLVNLSVDVGSAVWSAGP
jgi:Tol biopolymer transport system component